MTTIAPVHGEKLRNIQRPDDKESDTYSDAIDALYAQATSDNATRS